MAYLNQPWFNRQIVNRFTTATGIVHSQTLTVMKRFSKQPQKIPVTPVEVDGVKYLVSTRGEAEWVKNVRVDPNVTLTTKSGTTKYVANETPVANRRPILDAYKVKAGKVVEGYFRKLPDPADHRVFTLTPGDLTASETLCPAFVALVQLASGAGRRPPGSVHHPVSQPRLTPVSQMKDI